MKLRRTLLITCLTGSLLVGCNLRPEGDPWRDDREENFARNEAVAETITQGIVFGIAAAVVGIFSVGGSLIQLARGGSTPEIVDAARTLANENADATKQFFAINQLAETRAGREEPYVDLYAAIAAQPDEAPLLRATATRALNRAGAWNKTEILTSLLTDDDTLVRLEAAKALGNVPDPEAADELLARALADDEDVDVRLAAVESLARYRQVEVVEQLAALLDDDDFAIAFQARSSLALMFKTDRGYDSEAWLALAFEGAEEPAS
jgi:hypothetical protein